MSTTLHTITAVVHNEPGTMKRLTSLFRRRMFNIASINAGDCEQEGFSRVTLLVEGDDLVLRQCVRQLEKQVDVVEVDDLQRQESVQRELALFEVAIEEGTRRAVLDIAQTLGCSIVHLEHHAVTLQVADEPTKIDHLASLLSPYGIRQLVRSGLVAIRVK